MPDLNLSLLKRKLQLFEYSQNYACVLWSNKDEIKVISVSNEFPFLLPNRKYLISDVVHKNDVDQVIEYYKNVVKESIYDQEFRSKSGIKLNCSSQTLDSSVLSIWTICKENNWIKQFHIAAHDIRSPIDSIMGVATLVQQMVKDGEMDDNQLHEMLNMIKNTCYQATDLTNDILELATVGSKKYSLKTRTVVMKDFLEQYLHTHRLLTLKKKMKVELKAQTNANVRMNRSKITRVLDNLMTNAVKFSNVGSVIRIELIEKSKSICVKIIDEGVGMSQTAIDNLFVKFGKAKRRGLDGEISHGLGMSIVKQIMDLHKGKVIVESEVDKGTSVSLIFNL